MCLQSQPTPTDTESVDNSTYHLKNLAMLRTFCTCSINLIKNPSSLILSLSEHLKFFSYFMPSTNLTVPLQQSDICHHPESMSTLVLQVPQVLYMDLSTEERMKPFWECWNKSVRKKTSHNLLRTSKIERNYCMDLATEYIKVTIQELRSLSKSPMKCSKWLEGNSLWK